jgi:hypothetical protein
MGDVGQLLRAGQATQEQVGHGIAPGLAVGQNPGQQFTEPMPVEESGEGEQAGSAAYLLVVKPIWMVCSGVGSLMNLVTVW